MERYPVEEWAMQIEGKMNALDARIETELRRRYARDFKVVRRKISSEEALVTLYASPVDDPALMFRVNVTDGPVIRDDYVAFLRLREYTQALTGALNQVGLEAEAEAVIPDLEDTTGQPVTATLPRLLGLEGVDGMLVRVALKGPIEDISPAVNVLKASGLALKAPVVFMVYVFEGDGFDACRQSMLELPSTSDAIIRSHEPAARFTLAVEDGAARIAEAHGITIEGVENDGR